MFFGLYHQENYIFLVLKYLSMGFSYKGQKKKKKTFQKIST